MSGEISATNTSIQNVLGTIQRKPPTNAPDVKNISRDVFADDIYLSNKTPSRAHAAIESGNEALNGRDRDRRRFFRRRHSFGLFRWREARAFFRRMLFEPQKAIQE